MIHRCAEVRGGQRRGQRRDDARTDANQRVDLLRLCRHCRLLIFQHFVRGLQHHFLVVQVSLQDDELRLAVSQIGLRLLQLRLLVAQDDVGVFQLLRL